MSEVKVNKISPRSGTALTVGDSGDTVTVAGNVVKTNAVQAADAGNIISQSGTTITLGASGDTINVASGATLVGGGIDWQSSIVTASTVTVEAGKGYWINTTSNTCTITLPSSGSVGDEIKFADYDRTWGTNKIIIDPNGLNYQGQDDSYTIEYNINGQSLNIVYSGSTKGWIPFLDKEVADVPVAPATQKAIIGYGGNSSGTSKANLVNSSGVIASDISIAGTDRDYLAATSYGGDKAAFAYGYNGPSNTALNVKNLVNNSGVVAADVTGVGTARYSLAAASYGGDKGIFGYGKNASSNQLSMTNLINNSGVIATDVTGVGTGRYALAAARYGGDKAIFGFGIPNTGRTNVTNLVSSSGVVASNSTGVGTARASLAAAAYGGDKAIFGYGESTSASLATTNKVSNSGVVASDTSGVGTVRYSLTATDFGGDKALFFGGVPGPTAISNLVSNTGVVASNTSGASGVTGKSLLAGVGYSYSA